MVATVKNTVTLQPRMGEWIPIDCNLNNKNNNDFLYPVVFNSIIERNLMLFKFSTQAGALRSPAIYIFNNTNDVFVQFRMGDSVAGLVNLKIRGGVPAEDRGSGAMTMELVR